MKRAFDWSFRSRVTGRITIAQWPNVSLAIVITADAVNYLLSDTNRPIYWIGRAALVWWALDEIIRGVNPFRRALGAAVLALFIWHVS